MGVEEFKESRYMTAGEALDGRKLKAVGEEGIKIKMKKKELMAIAGRADQMRKSMNIDRIK